MKLSSLLDGFCSASLDILHCFEDSCLLFFGCDLEQNSALFAFVSCRGMIAEM